MGSLMFKKKDWKAVDGYDEKMRKGFEDWEFYIRVCKLGWEVHVIKEPLFYYRQHISSMRKEAILYYDSFNKEYIFNKHKKIYVQNFKLTLNYLLNLNTKSITEKQKIINSVEYRLGTLIMQPLRFFKKIITNGK